MNKTFLACEKGNKHSMHATKKHAGQIVLECIYIRAEVRQSRRWERAAAEGDVCERVLGEDSQERWHQAFLQRWESFRPRDG